MALLDESIVAGQLGHLSDAQQIHKKLNATLDVKADFGAAGDGSTDDTSAITTAVAALRNVKGGSLFFPAGIYNHVGITLDPGDSHMQWVGTGRRASQTASKDIRGSRLHCTRTDSGTGVSVTGTSSSDAVTGLVFRDLELSGTSSAGDGLKCDWLSHCSFENVRVTGFGGHGVNLEEVNTCTFKDVTSDANTTDGLRMRANCHGNGFYACAFKNNGGWGVVNEGAAAAVTMSSPVITGNTLGGAWIKNGRGWTWTSPYFEVNGVIHLRLGDTPGGLFPRGTVVIGPYFNSLSASPTPIGFSLEHAGAGSEHMPCIVLGPVFAGTFSDTRMKMMDVRADLYVDGIGIVGTFSTTTNLLKDSSGTQWDAPKTMFRVVNGLVREWADFSATGGSRYFGQHLVLAGEVEMDAALNHDGTTVGFYGTTPTTQQILATGAGATVDNVITALQNLGLVKQS